MDKFLLNELYNQMVTVDDYATLFENSIDQFFGFNGDINQSASFSIPFNIENGKTDENENIRLIMYNTTPEELMKDYIKFAKISFNENKEMRTINFFGKLDKDQTEFFVCSQRESYSYNLKHMASLPELDFDDEMREKNDWGLKNYTNSEDNDLAK